MKNTCFVFFAFSLLVYTCLAQDTNHPQELSPVLPVVDIQGHPLLATLQDELDKSYYTTSPDSCFYFTYREDYYQEPGNLLDCHIYDWTRREIGRVKAEKVYGYNFFGIKLGEVCQPGEFYVMEVFDDHRRRQVLRFRYDAAIKPKYDLRLSHSDPGCPGDPLTFTAVIRGGTAPYKVEWTVVPIPVSHSAQTITTAAPDAVFSIVPAAKTNYRVSARVTDACDNVTESTPVPLQTRDCSPPAARKKPGLLLSIGLGIKNLRRPEGKVAY